ncbi:MAG: galactose ABC transporter substrate-binding protein [Betaproteobacteria bacterium]|nr:galactose ABC transporter substrate-binding protein [Betaproteobacteria bacterium]
MHCLKNLRFGMATLILLCGCFSLGACDNDSSPHANNGAKPLVGILIYWKDDVYISLVADTLSKLFADRAEVLVMYGRRDQLRQDEQLETLIEKKVQALIINIVDPQAASRVVDKAKKAGIPAIFFNREPDLKILKAYDKSRFVGTALNEAGTMQGELIARIWAAHPEYDRNKDGVFQYVMFQGGTDNPEAVARTEYSVKHARELGVPLQQVGETNICDWDEELARQAMRRAVASYGDKIELVISNNDSMALGAIAALQEAGFNKEGGPASKFLPVVGVDATPRGIDAIQKGVMSATVRQNGEKMAEAIVALTMNALGGKDFLANMDYAWDGSGVAIRIPYSIYEGKK